MAIINKQKLTETDLRKQYIWSIVYELAFDAFDMGIIFDNMEFKGEELIIDLRKSTLNMDILYFHKLITPNYNKFLEKDITKLTILTENEITFDIINSWVSKNTGYQLYFKDGFILSSSIPLNYQ